jgi:hypothetical protein
VQTSVDQLTISVPFTASVTLDADLSANEPGYKKVSEIIPDATKRTFPIKGEITEVDWGNLVSSNSHIPFKPEYRPNMGIANKIPVQ